MDNLVLFKRVLSKSTQKPFLIAEVAQAHDGSLGQALSFIDAVAEAGANAIKFQTHIADEESSNFDDFRVRVFPQDATRKDYWKRMQFSKDEWLVLAAHSENRGLVFLSSPFSKKAVDILSDCEIAAWKIASGEIFNYPMLDKILLTNKPLLISTGMSSWQEIDEIWQYTHGNERVLFQCTTEYPSSPKNIGLNNIPIFKKKYPDAVIGLSDHSGEIYPSLAAYMLGARVFEVHVAWSKKMFGPDTLASLTIEQLEELSRNLNLQAQTLASPVDKNLMRQEKNELVKLFGRGIYAKREIAKGDVISETDLNYLKPSLGINAKEYRKVIGATAANKICLGEPIYHKDLK